VKEDRKDKNLRSVGRLAQADKAMLYYAMLVMMEQEES